MQYDRKEKYINLRHFQLHSLPMKKLDITIIGGGIIGLATGWQMLLQRQNLKVVILEKESQLGQHQTGHNSGVIHSGIYYRPGSLKAKNCVAGVKELLHLCERRGIPYETCGKVIIATSNEELPRLEELERRGIANGVKDLQLLSSSKLRDIEPAAKGIKALYSPHTAIVDYVRVAKEYGKMIQELGGEIHLCQAVQKLKMNNHEILIQTKNREFCTKYLINCAGIHADRIAHLANPSISPYQILPFRGEYYEVKKEKRDLVKGLIYPVPDPKFPFLGVHLSKTINGSVEAGPNAILALSREGYNKRDFNFQDCKGYLSSEGLWKMVRHHWKTGLYEIYRSYSKKAFLKSLQRLVSGLEIDDIIPGGSGVRSQIIKPDGSLVDDFVIEKRERTVHVLNAPSPGATASISIGKHISNLAEECFDL
ncbi:MAG TPA: L-2-hydroxyglutarate oxidase [Waddliaceae bacterium]